MATATWQPTPGLTRGQWQQQAADLGQVGARGYNGQLWGELQQGDQGYDPQKAADYDALLNYGVGQGWYEPHKASFGGLLKEGWKSVAPVALAAAGGIGLSALGAGAGAATGSGAGGLGGGSGIVGGGSAGLVPGAAAPGAATGLAASAAPAVAGLATVAPVATTGAKAMTAGGFFGIANNVLGTALGVNALFGDPLSLGGDNGEDASALAGQISADQWNYYKENYRPLEQNLINQAMEAGSPEEFARARGVANADVTGSFDRTRKDIERDMQSAGINPASPAYVGNSASVRIAEGGSRAGALTAADNLTRDKAYSKGLDVVGLGKGIPAQSAASSLATGNSQFLQNQTNMVKQGDGLSSLFNNAEQLYGTAKKWFEPTGSGANTDAYDNMAGAWKPTNTPSNPFLMKDGGLVPMLKEKGFSDDALKVLTPHMRGFRPRGYADGGGVGLDSVTIDHESGQVIGPGTGTSDGVPAVVDGLQPAALSSGEFVVNQAAVEMSGSEMLEAINRAGLEKREGRAFGQGGLEPAPVNMSTYRHGGRVSYARGGLEPKSSNDVPRSTLAYRRGGRVSRVGLGAY